MPLFEYECKACGSRFEVLVRGTEQPRCPKCGGDHLEKCLSVFAVSTKAAPAPQSACAACPHAAGPAGCGMAH